MFRKIAIFGLAAVAGLFILNSTHLGSYAKTAWKKVRASAKAQIPLDTQLEAIRCEVSEFMPELRRQVGSLAAETVAVQGLRQEVADIHASLDKQRSKIVAMKDELRSNTVKTGPEGRSNDRLRSRLERDLASYKRCSEELKAKEALVEAKEQALEADKEKLATMRSQKEQWEVQIAQMETEVKLLRAAQSKCSFQVDDSKYERIKGTLADIRNQIKVQQTENAMWGAFVDDGGTVEKKTRSTAQVIKEAEEIVGDTADNKEAQK